MRLSLMAKLSCHCGVDLGFSSKRLVSLSVLPWNPWPTFCRLNLSARSAGCINLLVLLLLLWVPACCLRCLHSQWTWRDGQNSIDLTRQSAGTWVAHFNCIASWSRLLCLCPWSIAHRRDLQTFFELNEQNNYKNYLIIKTRNKAQDTKINRKEFFIANN